jgi:NitT/TauT family transport system permease protein
LAAFPANLLFPIAVFLMVRYRLSPEIWTAPLMILGTQWYILFNVIAGASSIPGDMREAAKNMGLRGWKLWQRLLLPGIFPALVTGLITASGGTWNASIVAEVVSWGDTKLVATGLGAYIAEWSEKGSYPHIVLGIVVMSIYVVAMNRFLWRRLYAMCQTRYRLD